MAHLHKFAGQRFGRLFILEITHDPNHRALAKVKCDCGNIKTIRLDGMQSGRIVSCGCYHQDSIIKHGESGAGATKEYNTWKGLKARTLNPKNKDYHNYGGRGIGVSPKWIDSYDTFLADVGRAPSAKHTLDRIKNSKDYKPGNVRWATVKQQSRNTRRTVLNPFIAEKIRELRSQEMMPREIIDFLGVSMSNIGHVLYSKQWLGV